MGISPLRAALVCQRLASANSHIAPQAASLHGWKMTRKPHVLVADDSRTIATLLERGLQQSGFEVTVVHCGEEALDVARSHQFDLVLSDHQMLEISGIELCRRLRVQPTYQGVPFVLLTAASVEHDPARLRDELGITSVLTKPFDLAEVVRVVNDAIASRAY